MTFQAATGQSAFDRPWDGDPTFGQQRFMVEFSGSIRAVRLHQRIREAPGRPGEGAAGYALDSAPEAIPKGRQT